MTARVIGDRAEDAMPTGPTGDPRQAPTFAALVRAIREVAPDVFLVEPRVLRRVVRQDQGLGMLERQAPHRRSYAIDRARALEILDRDELGLPEDAVLPETLILLIQPEPDDLDAMSADELLLDAWRNLAHARVQAEMVRRIRSGALDRAAVLDRIDRIGQTEFDEIRGVLRQERYLHDSRNLIQAYAEFAAVFVELRYFVPRLLPSFFPTLGEPARVESILAADLDLAGLVVGCRPRGAPELPDPRSVPTVEEDQSEDSSDGEADEELEPWVRTRWLYRFLVRRAGWASAQGNHVRAAIRRMRAARVAPVGWEEAGREAARRELDRLARRLGEILGLDRAEVANWRRALAALLPRAQHGLWTREARLLYDLQKVVNDADREVYTVDLVEWVRTLGRRPLKRPLPYHREVLVVNHLNTARRRLSKIRLPEADRELLTPLLNNATERARVGLRETLRPVINQTLARCGWRPANLPERVALGKLVEELLDRIVDRGFLNMGDLRDAVSRSALKLPDLSGPSEFWRGDRLLQTDHALALAVDGVYRRGEVYLRWLQRLSSLSFGTRIGRWATLFIALPFGGAYVLLHGLDHLVHPIAAQFGEHADAPQLHLFNPVAFVSVGLLLMSLVNSVDARTAFLRIVRATGTVLRRVFYDLPAWFLGHPWVRAILSSRLVTRLARWLFKPLVFALATALVLQIQGASRLDRLALGLVAYIAAALLLNSRRGRDIEEILADRLVRFWHRLRRDLIPGLFRLVMEVFNRFLETVEQVLYAIDEWLRFKSGQGRIALAAKAIIGFIWFVITYIVRIYVNLLIEPQVNPIKHFPVVTVSHKLMIPFLPHLLYILRAPLLPLVGPWVANSVAGATLFLLPGVFGFLVWELKENWKLYEANRARNLRPVVVGHHGETMARLLRPGFHSGTVPKLFARLRRAERRTRRRIPGRARKHRDRLHHVEEEVRRFLHREFLALLDLSRAFADGTVSLGAVHLGTNRIRVELHHRRHADETLMLDFEEQSGWLVAGVADPGWLPALSAPERATLRDALAGLYKLSGVDLVRDQIESLLGPEPPPYDISDAGLVIWPGAGYQTEIIVAIRAATPVLPLRASLPLPGSLPQPDPARLVFSRMPLSWIRWVKIWERDRRGRGHPVPAIEGVALLPGSPGPAEPAGRHRRAQ